MSQPARLSLPNWPRLMSEPQAASYLSLSTTTLRKVGPGAKKQGRRKLYDRHDLDRWADRLAEQPLDETAEQEEAAEIERRFLEDMRGGG